jgi:hypothetical protein
MFYRYVTSQLFGGWLSAKIGGKKMFGIGIGVIKFLQIVLSDLLVASSDGRCNDLNTLLFPPNI